MIRRVGGVEREPGYAAVERWLEAHVPPGGLPDQRACAEAIGRDLRFVFNAFHSLKRLNRWRWRTQTRREIAQRGAIGCRRQHDPDTGRFVAPDETDDRPGVYLPTPQEIRVACLRIRAAAGWLPLMTETRDERPAYAVERWHRADPALYPRRTTRA